LLEDESFDRVIIDSPAGIESGFQTAASGAQGALVVVNPEVSSVRDADRIIGLLEAREITEDAADHQPAAAADGQARRHARGRRRARDPRREADRHRPGGRARVGVDERRQPGSLEDGNSKVTAGSAFRDIARRIRGEDVAYPDLESSKGVFAGLRRLFGGR
jgi:septum site-determining protein MinD